MALTAAVGQAHALDGREAGSLAAQRALDQFERVPATRGQAAVGLVVASSDYAIQHVVNGVSALLGDTPLFGFSATGELTSSGQRQRTVVVGLLAGSDLKARAEWIPGDRDRRAALLKAAQVLQVESGSGTLLVAADGLDQDAFEMVEQIHTRLLETIQNPEETKSLVTIGCQSAGDLRHGQTYQIGGKQSGGGGLAAAFITGPLQVGVGFGHGWQEIGVYFKITQAQGLWIRELDDQPPDQVYAAFFKNQAGDWRLPPLNELVRLYPLSIETNIDPDQEDGKRNNAEVESPVASPLKVDGDGSLRMNMMLREGSLGHLLVGSSSACISAAKRAAQQALEDLRQNDPEAQPVLALLLVDVAWQMLFQADPGAEVRAVQSILGEDLPLIGGYTLGQITSVGSSKRPEVRNQQIEVILFG